MSTANFVEQLYSKFLGRPSDAHGKSWWVNQIDSGKITALEATLGFLQSPEFSSLVTPIALLYYTALGRIPDTNGLQFWTKKVQEGTTLPAVSVGFVNSSEFQNKYAALDDPAFLNKLYQNVFGREPDAPGKAYWLDRMQVQGVSRADVIQGFAGSPEQASAKGEEIKVIVQFHGILNVTPTQTQINTALKQTDPLVKIAELYLDSRYKGEPVPGLTQEKVVVGKVIDGYVAGASVFSDANGNGIWDQGEAKALTDDKGSFKLVGAKGTIIATGGTDISTGKAFNSVMKAPDGASVVTPLTTLQQAFVERGMTPVEAQAQVVKVMGLNTDATLASFDPLVNSLDKTVDTATQQLGVRLHAASAKIANLLTLATSTIIGAAGGKDSLDIGKAVDAVVDALASGMAASQGQVDLSDSAFLKKVLEDGASAAGGAGISTKVSALSDSFSKIAADSAKQVDRIAAAGADVMQLIARIVQVQTLAQGETADAMQNAALSGGFSALESRFTGDALTKAVEASPIGDLDPASKDDDAVIGNINGGVKTPAPGSGSGGGGGGGAASLPERIDRLDQLLGTDQHRATVDTSSVKSILNDDAGVASYATILGYGADDAIHFTLNASSFASFSSIGRDVWITCNRNGVVSSIQLKDVLTGDALVYDAASFNALPVGDIFFDGTPYQQSVILDGRGSLAVPATLDASNGMIEFVDSALAGNAVRIVNYGADDRVKWTGATASTLSISSKGADVIATINYGGTISTITLVGVISSGDVVYDVASFNSLAVGDFLFN